MPTSEILVHLKPAVLFLLLAGSAQLALPHLAVAQDTRPRFEIGPVLSIYAAGADYSEPTQYQFGGRFSWNCLSHLALEGEYGSTVRYPLSATSVDGGYFSQALFGIKPGIRWQRWGIFAKFRPGFVHYSGIITGATESSRGIALTYGSLTEPAFDLGGGAEFFMSRHFLFRYDLSDLLVHEGVLTTLINGQAIPTISFTQNHFEAEASLAFRF